MFMNLVGNEDHLLLANPIPLHLCKFHNGCILLISVLMHLIQHILELKL